MTSVNGVADKVKVKEEPKDYAEHVQYLLANAKSAYCNTFEKEERQAEVTNGYKRKSIVESEMCKKKGKYVDVSSMMHSSNKQSRYDTRYASRKENPPRGETERQNFPCLLCEKEFNTEDDRMMHVTLIHKSKSNTGRRQGMRMARHTCQICFARFRTLRDFFTHTAGHAQDPNLTAMQRDVSDSLAKNTLQQFLMNSVSSLGKDMLQPSFKCDCCETVFTNRDSYAMHVMMKVKDDCSNSPPITKKMWTEISDRSTGGSVATDKISPKTDISTAELNQAYYIDVTNVAEKDEYLQSVLTTAGDHEKTNHNTMMAFGGRKCSLCSKSFIDQDSLAMHVMSNHAEDISTTHPEVSLSTEKEAKMQMAPSMLMRCHLPMGRNGPLSVHGELLYCDFCRGIFTNRDTLAMHMLSHTTAEAKKERHVNINPRLPPQINLPRTFDEKRSVADQPLNLVAATKIIAESKTSPTQKTETNGVKVEKHFVSINDNSTKRTTDVTLDDNDSGTSSMTSSEQDYQKRKYIYRSLSLPDMRSIERKLLPRPKSTSNIVSDSYVYLLNDTLSGYSSDFTNTEEGVDLSQKSVTHSHGTHMKLIDSRESETSSCSLAPEDISDPRQLLRELDRPVYVCRLCEIIFLNRTLYYLHKGLHNVNNPWQCNMCGKVCSNVHDFSAHVIHL